MTRRVWIVAAAVLVAAVLVAVVSVLGRGAARTTDATPPASTSSPTPSPTLTPTVTSTPTLRPTPTPTSTLLPVRRDDAGTARVLITGDSLAAGFFATTQAQGFSALVADALGPVEVTTVSRAHQTLTTVAGITEVPADLDLAVIELGTNDVGIPTPREDFDAQYHDLLARVRSTSPDAALVCLGTWTGDGAAYDEIIARLCADSGGRYIPLAGLFATADFHGPDGRDTFVGPGDDFHPNDAGHRAIADAVLAVLAR